MVLLLHEGTQFTGLVLTNFTNNIATLFIEILVSVPDLVNIFSIMKSWDNVEKNIQEHSLRQELDLVLLTMSVITSVSS